MSADDYEILQARELARWPGVVATPGKSGRHRRVTLTFGENSRDVVFPATPSDRRGPLNHACTIRRVLRQLGAVRR